MKNQILLTFQRHGWERRGYGLWTDLPILVTLMILLYFIFKGDFTLFMKCAIRPHINLLCIALLHTLSHVCMRKREQCDTWKASRVVSWMPECLLNVLCETTNDTKLTKQNMTYLGFFHQQQQNERESKCGTFFLIWGDSFFLLMYYGARCAWK